MVTINLTLRACELSFPVQVQNLDISAMLKINDANIDIVVWYQVSKLIYGYSGQPTYRRWKLGQLGNASAMYRVRYRDSEKNDLPCLGRPAMPMIVCNPDRPARGNRYIQIGQIMEVIKRSVSGSCGCINAAKMRSNRNKGLAIAQLRWK